MDAKENGRLSAAPVVGMSQLGNQPTMAVFQAGLSKREAFAMAAMQGMLASWPSQSMLAADACARMSVAHADALLAQLATPATNRED